MDIIIFMMKRKEMAMITLMNIAEVRRKILMSKQHFYTLWVI
jgi:hypothetical protein